METSLAVLVGVVGWMAAHRLDELDEWTLVFSVLLVI